MFNKSLRKQASHFFDFVIAFQTINDIMLVTLESIDFNILSLIKYIKKVT